MGNINYCPVVEPASSVGTAKGLTEPNNQ